MREAILELVRVERDWVPASPGTSLYIRPTLIATEPFLGVRPSKRYIFFIIASPVGAYHGEAFAPVKIWVEDKYVRAAPGGLGAVKAGANYVASLLAAEEAKKRGYAQVLWTDADEHRCLEEVGTMNLFVRIGDEFVTPPLDGTHPRRASPATRSSRCCASGASRVERARASAIEELHRGARRGDAARGVRLRHRGRDLARWASSAGRASAWS